MPAGYGGRPGPVGLGHAVSRTFGPTPSAGPRAGSDSNSDTAPSVVEGVAFAVHVLAINATGLHLLDYLQFDEAAARWSFLCVVAPLRLPGGTCSPVNPIAIL